MSLAYEQSFASLPSSPISSYQLQPKCLRAFRYSLLIGGLLLSVLFAGRADAQTSVQNDSNNTAVGFPEGGAFSGSDIDNVQMNNGNLHVTIPLWSAPGRGGVGQTYAFTYDTKGFYLSLSGCTDASTPCNYGVLPEQGHTMIMGVNGAAAPGISNRIGFRQVCEIAPPYFTIYSGVAAREWNGTKHAMAPGIYTISASSQDCWATANSTFYASDGSGWAGTYQNFVSKSGGDPDLSDTNGNTTGNLGLPASTGLTYTDANGVHQTIGVTTEVVAISTHLCVPSLQQPASNGSCTEYSASWTVPHIITLPNGLRYTIEYVQNDQGQISSITLPTGAVISYSYQTSPSGTFDGKRVASRTVTVGSQVSTWNYTFNAADSAGNLASSVKDPSQASITYTCTPIESLYSSAGVDVLNPAPCYMTKEVHTDASGNPLETITTDYDQRVTGAPVPIRNTTTWVGTNQVKKIEMDYETITAPMFPNGSAGPSTAPVTWGNVSALREYDWGTGAPGSLLRQTLTSYLHTDTTVNPNANRTAYLARNIADRPTAIIIKDGSGTIVAQTKYFYDEGGLISTSSNPALNHDYTNFSSNFMIRGNLTRVQRWLNTTSTWLTTSYAYDDLGNKRTMTDPNGNVTSYDYTDSFTGASCNQTGKPTYAFLTTVTSPAPFNFLTKYSYYGCTGQLASDGLLNLQHPVASAVSLVTNS